MSTTLPFITGQCHSSLYVTGPRFPSVISEFLYRTPPDLHYSVGRKPSLSATLRTTTATEEAPPAQFTRRHTVGPDRQIREATRQKGFIFASAIFAETALRFGPTFAAAEAFALPLSVWSDRARSLGGWRAFAGRPTTA